jgi:hypothetical protein
MPDTESRERPRLKTNRATHTNGAVHTNGHSTGRPPRTRQEFARLITAAWNRQVSTIVSAGRLLREAKTGPNKLPHGEFLDMFRRNSETGRRDLPFGERTAQKLMAIARHPVLSDPSHESHLPPHVETLYLLTKLPQDQLEQMLTDGTITAETERKEVEKLVAECKDRYRKVVDAFEVLITFDVRADKTTKRGLVEVICNEWVQGQRIYKQLPFLAQWFGKLEAECKAKFNTPEGRKALAAAKELREEQQEQFRKGFRLRKPLSFTRRQQLREQCEHFNSIRFRSKAERKAEGKQARNSIERLPEFGGR